MSAGHLKFRPGAVGTKMATGTGIIHPGLFCKAAPVTSNTFLAIFQRVGTFLIHVGAMRARAFFRRGFRAEKAF